MVQGRPKPLSLLTLGSLGTFIFLVWPGLLSFVWLRPTFLLCLCPGFFRVRDSLRPKSLIVFSLCSSGSGIGPGPNLLILWARASLGSRSAWAHSSSWFGPGSRFLSNWARGSLGQGSAWVHISSDFGPKHFQGQGTCFSLGWR